MNGEGLLHGDVWSIHDDRGRLAQCSCWYEVREKQVESGALSANDMKDVQSVNAGKPEQIAGRITRYGWLAPEQTMITSSCGMNHLPRHIVFGKLQAMAVTKELLASPQGVAA